MLVFSIWNFAIVDMCEVFVVVFYDPRILLAGLDRIKLQLFFFQIQAVESFHIYNLVQVEKNRLVLRGGGYARNRTTEKVAWPPSIIGMRTYAFTKMYPR